MFEKGWKPFCLFVCPLILISACFRCPSVGPLCTNKRWTKSVKQKPTLHFKHHIDDSMGLIGKKRKTTLNHWRCRGSEEEKEAEEEKEEEFELLCDAWAFGHKKEHMDKEIRWREWEENKTNHILITSLLLSQLHLDFLSHFVSYNSSLDFFFIFFRRHFIFSQ